MEQIEKIRLKIKRCISATVHTMGCNLQCEYCYLRQTDYVNNKEVRALRYPLETVLKACSTQRLGGECYFTFVGDGETLLPIDIVDIVCGLIENGHYVTVVTNGTLLKRIMEIVERLKKKNLLSHIEFSLSLHYLELKRLGLLETFTESIRYLKENKVSLKITLTLDGKYLEIVDEIKEYCGKSLKMQPIVVIARTNDYKQKILADCSEEEYFAVGDKFESRNFEKEKKRYKYQYHAGEEKKFCYAGAWLFNLDMTTGMYAQCTANEVLKYNFFENLDEDAILEAVGTHCKLPYCVCGHADAHNLIPGGCNFCEKIDSANEELQWVTEEMRWIQNANLAYSNEEFTEEKKASCNDRNTMYNYVQHTANLIRCDFREERYDKVIERAEEILVGDLNPRNYWILDVILKYGYALLRTGKMEQALDLASCYEELNYNADYCLLMGLIYLQNGQIENAISLFEEATTKYSWFENGTNSFMAWYNLGVIYECLGDVEKATAYYKKCGDYQDAKHRLNEIY